ncbi:MAG TPA: endolytic transglycosylase MltG, partial [Ktedonobacterales bacterium]
MRRTGLTVTAILTLLAFALGFLGVTAGLDLTQPVSQDDLTVTAFQVRPGDAAGVVASHLEHEGLIRNALLFKVLAGARHLDAHLQPGTYQLSPDMTMDMIIHQLLTEQPGELPIEVPSGKVLLNVPPGARVAQLPALASGLANFHPKAFLTIATNGVLPDGKALSDQYWYVRPKQPNVIAALEGYVLPGAYFFNPSDDEVAVVNALLTAVGTHLCPGPDAGHLDAYLHDMAECK